MADETVNLANLLEVPLSNFPDRPNLPGGKTFYGKLVGIADTASSQKGTPGFHFDIRLTDPGADVPKDALDKITAANFTLADYTAGADFWLTPGSMVFLRRFLMSLGFDENKSIKEQLKLTDEYMPTPDSQEILRGMDIIIKTPPADAEGRVFLNNVSSNGGSIAGVKRG